MLANKKILKSIENEIKSQKTLLKLLNNQETNYNVDLSSEIKNVIDSIAFYENVLKEAA